ncbi:MAG: hypothetical protein ACRDKT_12950 [Actinomycetota bacterium]
MTVNDPQEPTWTSSDAWFLTAAWWANHEVKPAPLDRIIGAGDALNHSIFIREEIVQAVSRLRAAELIELDGRRFRVTDRADELLKSADRYGFILHRTERELRTVSFPASIDEFGISEDEFKDAVETYHRRAQETLRRIRGAESGD